MTTCGPWLEAELNVVEPELIVVLGATAGKALLGSSFRLSPICGWRPGLRGDRPPF
jgi:DNA polymerase